MHQIFKKWTMLLKMGLIMAIAAMVIVNPAWRAELQAKDERGGCDPSSQCCVDFHNCKDEHSPQDEGGARGQEEPSVWDELVDTFKDFVKKGRIYTPSYL